MNSTAATCCCLECPGSCLHCERKHISFCLNSNIFKLITEAAQATNVSFIKFVSVAALEKIRADLPQLKGDSK